MKEFAPFPLMWMDGWQIPTSISFFPYCTFHTAVFPKVTCRIQNDFFLIQTIRSHRLSYFLKLKTQSLSWQILLLKITRISLKKKSIQIVILLPNSVIELQFERHSQYDFEWCLSLLFTTLMAF